MYCMHCCETIVFCLEILQTLFIFHLRNSLIPLENVKHKHCLFWDLNQDPLTKKTSTSFNELLSSSYTQSDGNVQTCTCCRNATYLLYSLSLSLSLSLSICKEIHTKILAEPSYLSYPNYMYDLFGDLETISQINLSNLFSIHDDRCKFQACT